MRGVILIAAVLSFGYLNAHSESRLEKKYERYENGELVEDQYYLEQNGKVISGRDFEMPNFDKLSVKMDAKMAEMNALMENMQAKFDQKRVEMEQRMSEMKKRSEIMQKDMERRMSGQKMNREGKPTKHTKTNDFNV